MRFGYGYVQGVDAAAKELGITVDMKYAYGNQFFGDADITAVMDTWYSNGTEIVFACGGGIYTSAAEAAKKVGGKVIGVDTDQAPVIDGAYGEGMTITRSHTGERSRCLMTTSTRVSMVAGARPFIAEVTVMPSP